MSYTYDDDDEVMLPWWHELSDDELTERLTRIGMSPRDAERTANHREVEESEITALLGFS